jgi:hypothetical protein
LVCSALMTMFMDGCPPAMDRYSAFIQLHRGVIQQFAYQIFLRQTQVQ